MKKIKKVSLAFRITLVSSKCNPYYSCSITRMYEESMLKKAKKVDFLMKKMHLLVDEERNWFALNL